MPTRHLLLPLSVLIGFLGGGCALLSRFLQEAFTPPTINFKSANVGGFSLSDATINLVWELQNPNPVGVSLASLDYALQVEGKQVVAGKPPLGLRIAPQGATELTFPATIKFQDIAPVIETFLNKDTAAYSASGSVGIDTPIGVLAFPLQKSGTFEVPKIPKVEFLPPRITNLGFTSATVEFPLNITSRNSYALPIGNVGGALSIAGARVGTLSTGTLGEVAPGAPRMLKLPLTIQFAQAAQAAFALRSGSAQVGFDGAIQSGSTSIPLKFQQNLTFQH